LLVASATALLTGCSVADDVMATVGLPVSESAAAPEQPENDTSAMVVTDQQRGYLDALNAAGVKPSSELMALRIGSYVCQARAAKQSDQAVWDVVVPLVRGASATADYIRIATDKLC
jgi:hypothetical protein